jgi:hypothetical protein
MGAKAKVERGGVGRRFCRMISGEGPEAQEGPMEKGWRVRERERERETERSSWRRGGGSSK